ncbi:hypothetical protein [Acidihalobacter ferrooxydans]|uniref:Uncharacterized protein n=1 Tax=Acidihalobacter ferrooxydans TaxID=1765967 RepID=A0A1P8UFJ6_9GAMM|nr:hypothetical protein [Acidihalobacter ferrooxydans]APZ42524.1 hypothetical protein BW247_04980 [Acidihalobacter ferrooxydans]
MENPNKNCLEGMQCPECQSFGPFDIAADVMCHVYDEGSQAFGDHEWTDESFCECPKCKYSSTVAEFSGEQPKISPEQKMREFIQSLAELSLWDHDDDNGQPFEECDEPEYGYLDSHEALMTHIEAVKPGSHEATAVDTIGAMILAQKKAGFDIVSPAYLEALETVFDAVANNLTDDELPPGGCTNNCVTGYLPTNQ